MLFIHFLKANNRSLMQDYFIITPNIIEKWKRDLPRYVIGRRGYDNALTDWGYHHSNLVDLTETVKALHQTTGDGNYAGHSSSNKDMEYNVELPGAVYDHGSTTHAAYASSFDPKVPKDVLIVRRSDSRIMTRGSSYIPRPRARGSSYIPRPRDQGNMGIVAVWSSSYDSKKTAAIPPVLTPRLKELYSPDVCNQDKTMCKILSGDDTQIVEGLKRITNDDFLKGWRPWNSRVAFLIKENVIIHGEGDVRLCGQDEFIGSYGCRDYIIEDIPSSCGDNIPRYTNVITIAQYWGEGYFHSLIEGVPRLMQAIELLPTAHTVFDLSKWTVHSNMQGALATHIVALLGLQGAASGLIRADTAFIPRPTPCGGELGGVWVRRIRPRFLSAMAFPDAMPEAMAERRFIVCKRPEGNIRSLTNHEDILRTIQELWKEGRVIVHTGSESLVDQFRMFSTSIGVLAPHGAGLSNIAMMPSGALVIEVLPTMGSNRLNPCYLVLAFTLSHKYFALQGEFDSYGSGSLDLSLLHSLPPGIWHK